MEIYAAAGVPGEIGTFGWWPGAIKAAYVIFHELGHAPTKFGGGGFGGGDTGEWNADIFAERHLFYGH